MRAGSNFSDSADYILIVGFVQVDAGIFARGDELVEDLAFLHADSEDVTW